MLRTGLKRSANVAVMLHKTLPQVAQELHACIGCNECLVACPAVNEHVTIDVLNRETLSGPISTPVARFARSCFQCGACFPPCPLGLRPDAMMFLIRVPFLRSVWRE